MTVVSIQVAATHHTETSVEAVSKDSAEHTHFSVYLRLADGRVTHVKDWPVTEKGNIAEFSAYVKAAKLSMEHGVPIEPVQ